MAAAVSDAMTDAEVAEFVVERWGEVRALAVEAPNRAPRFEDLIALDDLSDQLDDAYRLQAARAEARQAQPPEAQA